MEEKRIKVENLTDNEPEAVDEEQLFLSEPLIMECPLDNYEWKKDLSTDQGSLEEVPIKNQSSVEYGFPIKQEKLQERENQQSFNGEPRGIDVGSTSDPFQFVECSQDSTEENHIQEENALVGEQPFFDECIKGDYPVDNYEWNKDRIGGPPSRHEQHSVNPPDQSNSVDNKQGVFRCSICTVSNLQQGCPLATLDVNGFTKTCVSSNRFLTEPSPILRWRFQSGSSLKSRSEIETEGEILLKRDHCVKTYKRKNNLDAQKPFKCDHCEKTFSQKDHLVVHTLLHTGEKLFKGDQCVTIGSTSDPFQFVECSQDSTEENHIQEENALDGKQAFFDERIKVDYPVDSHEWNKDRIGEPTSRHEHHSVNPLDQSNSLDNKEDVFRSSICTDSNLQQGRLPCTLATLDVNELTKSCVSSKRFFTEPSANLQTQVGGGSNLKSRPEIETGEGKLFKGNDCGKTDTRKNNLDAHKRLHTRVKPFKCDHCKKTFSRKVDLRAHMWVHTGKKPFMCSICNKTFSRKGGLEGHKLIHTDAKPFECDQCEKKFSRKDSLRMHAWVHMGEKLFNCRNCNKTFSQKGNLEVDNQLHTNVKRFKCDQCVRTFAQKCHLEVHKRRIHITEKPFKCDHCEKRFPEEDALVVHTRVHRGEKPFKCGDCNKTFNRKFLLTVHEQIHTNRKPFRCDQCEKNFFRKCSLTSHYRRVHKTEKPFMCDLMCDQCVTIG